MYGLYSCLIGYCIGGLDSRVPHNNEAMRLAHYWPVYGQEAPSF